MKGTDASPCCKGPRGAGSVRMWSGQARRLAAAAAITVMVGCFGASALATSPLAHGEHLLAQGHVRDARLELRNALRENSEAGNAAYLLARLDLDVGDPVSAEREAHMALAAGYAPERSLSILLQSLLDQKRDAELLHTYPVGNATGERAARIEVARGRANLALSRPDKAAQDFDRAATFDPNIAEVWLGKEDLALARGNLQAAAAALDKAESTHDDPDRVALRRGELLRAQHKPADAVAILTALVKNTPSFMPGQLALAYALTAAGEQQEARQTLTRFMTIVPNSGTGLYLQAVLDVQAHQWKAAKTALQRLQPVFEQIPQAYLLEAETDVALGLDASALEAARHYVGHRPDDPRGHVILASIALKTGHPDVALSTLGPSSWPKGVAVDSTVLGLRGQAELKSGALDVAHADFATAVAIAPRDARALTGLGQTDLALGKPEAAEIVLKRAASKPGAGALTQRLLAEAALVTADTATATSAIKALQQGGDVEAAAILRARLELMQGNLAEARATLEALTPDQRNTPAIRIDLARIDIMEGKFAAGLALLKPLAAQHPADPRLIDNIVSLQIASHDIDGAAKTLLAAHQSAPDVTSFIVALVNVDLARHDTIAAKTMIDGLDPRLAETPAVLMARAKVALAQHDQADAQRSLEAILKVDPKADDVRVALARLDISEKDTAAARRVLENGLANAPRDAALMQGLVAVALHEGGTAKALDEARRLAANTIHQPEGALLPGDFYLAQQEPKQAAAAYEAANRTTPSAVLAIAHDRALLAAGETEEAARATTASAMTYPEQSDFPLLLAEIALKRGHLPEAATNYRKVLTIAPNNIVALNNLAWIEEKLHKPDARALAQRAFSLAPTPQVADTLGWILLGDKQTAQALTLLAMAHRRQPNDLDITYHYAVVLNESGHAQQAVAVLKAVLDGKIAFRDRAAARSLYDQLSSGS